MNVLPFLAFFLSFIFKIHAEKDSTHCQSVDIAYSPDVSHGTFKSPGFPIHYCNNLRSNYEIEPQPGHAVSLSIEFFDTEPLHDFVEIHQMFSHNGSYNYAKQHVLSGPMGHQPRHFVSSLAGGLRVVFTTDTTENSFSGFQMSFTRFNPEHSLHVPCPFPFYDATDSLQTLPTMLRTYYHDTSCVIRINSTDAVKLKIRKLSTVVTLKLIETENFKSNRVHDVLENLNGFTTNKLPYDISSRTESLLLLFTFSGVLNDGPAYEIDYEHAVSVCTCNEPNIQVNSTVSKVFVSPGFPLEYCDFLNCQTKVTAMLDSTGITPPDGHQYNTVVQIIFNEFAVEIDVDFLQLIDKVPLLNLSDNAKGISAFTFEDKQVDLKFVSDHSVVEKGFNLSLQAYKKPYYCLCPDPPKIFGEASNEVNNTFEEMCKFMDCFWRIYPPSSESVFRIVMKVNYKLQAETEFIEISNGENLERNSEKLRLESDAIPDDGDTAERYVEFDAGNNPYVQIWYHRQGDDVAGKRIFNFEYNWKKRCQCGKEIREAKSDQWIALTSPDYPTQYCNNMNCTWLIQAPPQHRVVINITDFLTEIDQDYLVIFDGNSTNTSHLELLSGMEQFENLISTESNQMTILFSADISLSLRGFSLIFKAEPTEEYHRQNSGIFSKIPFFVLAILIILVAVTGTLAYLFKTQKLDSNLIDLRSIRFINRDRQRTESEASLMNPVFRPLSTNLR